MLEAPHREDLKADLRKRFGSIAAFERAYGLPARSVKDVMRGKSRPAVAQAIADALNVHVRYLFPARFKSPNGDNSNDHEKVHPQK